MLESTAGVCIQTHFSRGTREPNSSSLQPFVHEHQIPAYGTSAALKMFIIRALARDPLCLCCHLQGPDEAAARLVDGILRRKSFYFQQRSGKLDMRAIGRVDIDSVVKDVDIDTLQVP